MSNKYFRIISQTCLLMGTLFAANAQNGVGVNTNTPRSSFEDNGSFGKKVTTVTAATTTLDETYGSVVCNTGSTVVTLPVATGCAARVYEIKRAVGNASFITINVTSGGTIDGATSFLLSKAGQSVTVFSDGAVWLVRDGSGEGNNWSLTGNTGTTPATNFLGTIDAQDLQFKTSNNNAMRILAGGNVGIGNTAPAEKLHVSGELQVGDDPSATGVSNRLLLGKNNNNADLLAIFRKNISADKSRLVFLSGDNHNDLTNAAEDFFDFSVSDDVDNPLVRINTWSGNLAVNTNTPTSKLHVVANGAQTAAYAGTFLTNTATSTTANVIKKGLEVTSTGAWTGATAANIGIHVSSVSGGTANYDAIFNGGGNVGIGTNTPTQKLDVNGNVIVNGNNNLIVTGMSMLCQTTAALFNYGQGGYAVWNQTALASAATYGMTHFINHRGTGPGGFTWQNTNDMASFTNMMSLRVANDGANGIRLGIGTLTANSTLEVNGSTAKKVLVTPASITMDETHGSVVCDNGATPITITLPSATTAAFRVYEIKRRIAVANTATVTVGGTIDGTVNYLLSNPGQSVTVFSDGTNWLKRDGSNEAIAGNDWNILGNSGTAPATNFIGTTDAQDLTIRTNNTEKVRVEAGGNVGIGTADPLSLLHLYEATGSTPSATTGTLRLEHNNVGGTSTILFRSKQDPTTDFGYISYSDDGSGNGSSAENSLLTIGVGNNGSGAFQDDIAIMPSGNVGIGTTTPSEKLHVSGNIQLGDEMAAVEVGKQLLFSKFYNNTDPASIYRVNTAGDNSVIRFELGDNYGDLTGQDFFDFCAYDGTTTPALRIVTNNSNVGINAPNPTSRLHVIASDEIISVGGVVSPRTASYAGTFLSNISTSTTANITKKGLEVTSTGTWSGATASNIGIHVSSVTGGALNYDAIFDGGGNVGIGTTGPACRLDVRNDATGTVGDVKFQIARQNQGDVGMTFNQVSVKSYGIVLRDNTTATGTPGRLAFVDSYFPGGAGTEIMCIGPVPNGNVGIGTNAPTEKLHIYNTIAPYTLLESNGTSGKILAHKIRTWDGMAANTYVGYGAVDDGASSARAALYVPNAANNGVTEAVSILKSTGNVGINCNAPQYRLHVIGNAGVVGTIFATAASVSAGVVACSDIRYKKDIHQLNNSLENILKLKGVTYNWKVNEFPDKHFGYNKQIGFIAQELEKVYPELVNTDADGYKSVDYSRLTPILIEALKEQQSIIDGQSNINNQQNATINKLLTEAQATKTLVDELSVKLRQMEVFINAEAKK